MKWGSAILIVFSTGCLEEAAPLRFEPAELELTVELDAPARAPLRVLAGDADVTAEVTLALDGAPLGSVDATGFASDGRTGGRATIVATRGGEAATLPVRVVLRSTRFIDAPPGAAGWFDAARDLDADAALEPGDGAVLPANLGRLDVHFVAGVNDTHEVAVLGPELELRVFGRGDAAARRVELTAAEWDAIARTSRGGAADLVVRSLSSANPAEARRTAARLAIAELAFPAQVLFTGRPAPELPQLWTYELATASTERWASGPNGNCLGCHVALSRDGRRLAAGGSIDTAAGPVGGGLLVDTRTRYYAAPPSAAVGVWISAAFDPGGALVTAANGILTVRDGATALPRATLTPPLPANQPAISTDGRSLAYVAGPIDPATTNPNTQELRIHDWDAATATLGAPRTLVSRRDGEYLKLPDFSPDDRWIIYSRGPALFGASGSIMAIRADGSGEPRALTPDHDGLARFASPIATVHGGGPAAEPMAWIVMKSFRPVGGRSQTGIGQLWAMAFYPERGVASRPFHLPGQRPDVAVLHAPTAMP